MWDPGMQQVSKSSQNHLGLENFAALLDLELKLGGDQSSLAWRCAPHITCTFPPSSTSNFSKKCLSYVMPYSLAARDITRVALSSGCSLASLASVMRLSSSFPPPLRRGSNSSSSSTPPQLPRPYLPSSADCRAREREEGDSGSLVLLRQRLP
eukprot:CAMPEP_0172547182 /NCGR_PEP_ID=MMETSP1067-20121228/16769_1 /TAXON_ID=265564 ORGANISM="Thalassiosira punctigera, Strain Tpunct2005C2" /NCGR_SAMPLE_ID=MMETSP1067 /ASSEMBLY_ACC=CAM_ASM_000444 /LENGTH=152 /DNA_ID=CAMNT_0013334221 /DNA_START=75 /DNA_END=530 /DNA_ORIENTATION=+